MEKTDSKTMDAKVEQRDEVKSTKVTPKGAELRAKYLKANLPTLEISIYTAGWIGSVLYACYNVFLASRSKSQVFSRISMKIWFF